MIAPFNLRVPTLPLVVREMRLAARRWTTYWSRVTLLLVAMAPVVLTYMAGILGVGGVNVGRELILVQSGLLYFCVTVSAIQIASDAISFEKREGTLGLLFLTNLSVFDILMGKLAAASLRTWHGLMAAIPALGVPVLVGGATMGDCLRLALILGNTLFVTLAATLLMSTLCRREHQAAGWTVLLMGLVLGAIPLIQVAVQHPLLDLLNLMNPVKPLWTFLGATYQFQPSRFWTQILAAHLLGWALLVCSCLILPRVWQDRAAHGPRRRWRDFWQQWLLGSMSGRRSFRRKALESNPIYWYASRERRALLWPWLFLGLTVALLVVIYWLGKFKLDLNELMFLGWCVQLIFKHWITTSACRAYARPESNEGLAMVLCTPLSDDDLVKGPLRAFQQRFLGPVIAVLALQIIAAMLVPREEDWRVGSSESWGVVFVMNLLFFPLDLAAVTLVGMWKGATSKNASQAVSGTNWWILLLPWVITIGLVVLSISGSGPTPMRASDMVILMLLLSLAVDVAGIVWAGPRLRDRLRETLLERFAGGEPWLAGWRWVGRQIRESLFPNAP